MQENILIILLLLMVGTMVKVVFGAMRNKKPEKTEKVEKVEKVEKTK